jgi:hypothetical protein
LYAGESLTADAVAQLEATAQAMRDAAHGRIDVYLIAAADVPVAATLLPLVRDAQGEFARLYAASGLSAFIVRPDGYLGLAARGAVEAQDLVHHLKSTFR